MSKNICTVSNWKCFALKFFSAKPNLVKWSLKHQCFNRSVKNILPVAFEQTYAKLKTGTEVIINVCQTIIKVSMINTRAAVVYQW